MPVASSDSPMQPVHRHRIQIFADFREQKKISGFVDQMWIFARDGEAAIFFTIYADSLAAIIQVAVGPVEINDISGSVDGRVAPGHRIIVWFSLDEFDSVAG